MRSRLPDIITIYAEGAFRVFKGSDLIIIEDAELRIAIDKDDLSVRLSADTTPVRYIRFRWNFSGGERRDERVNVLGDEWERGYGRMEWRSIAPDRCMPWTCLVSNGSDAEKDTGGRFTEAFGVRTLPAALCFWQYDPSGVTLWMDVRNGGSGVILGGRTIEVCRVVFREYAGMTALKAMKLFYKELSRGRLEPGCAVYGGNTWYYSYGDITYDGVIEATRLIAELCAGLEKPFMVVDDGWSQNPTDGPWDRGSVRFPDMARLAGEISALGVRPGIWFRPLSDAARATAGIPEEARLLRDKNYLDPSHPSVQALTRDNVRRFVEDWGFELIKHDFTNYDVFGFWGFQRETTLTGDGWHFFDRSKTSAEIMTGLYRLIHEAAGDKTVLIGCNTCGHLINGLAHLNRTGDDTSGKDWERTRRYGVNTLAFRQAHEAFFVPDADCVGIRGDIPWKLNHEWLRAVARSGTPLFVSCLPGVCSAGELEELRDAFRAGSRQSDVLEPIDWMENTCPERWRLNGEEISFNWYPDEGTQSFKP